LGKFVKNGAEKITFVWRPGTFLKFPLKVTLYAKDFPNAKLDSEVLALFSIRAPLLRNSDGIAFPFLKQIFPPEEGKEVLEDPKSDLPPALFLEELAEDGSLQVHVAIGLPENDVIPTLSLSDFVYLSDTKTLSWSNISRCLLEKYKILGEEEEGKTARRFHDQLLKNTGNPGGKKTILLFPGRWNTFFPQVAHTLAQEILRNTRFGVFIATQAHPLSDRENVQELNPCVTGNSSLSYVEERIFFTTPIGFGEEVSGQVCYDFIHNTKSFFLLRIMKKNLFSKSGLEVDPSMFQKVTLFDFQKYKGPSLSFSRSFDNQEPLLLSFPRADKIDLRTLSTVKLVKRLLPDSDRVWSNYQVYQSYSPDGTLSKSSLEKFSLSEVGSQQQDVKQSPPAWIRVVCDQRFVVSPCDSFNQSRIVKLGRVDSIKKLEHRASPPAILQKLGLVDQVFPLSNHYFKVSLKEGVSDEIFCKTITSFDDGLGDRLFHSFWNGEETTLFHPPPPRRVFRSWEAQEDAPPPPGVVVVEDPPFSLTVAEVNSWATKLGITDHHFYCGVGPNGTNCAIIEFTTPDVFFPPTTANFCGMACFQSLLFLHPT